MFTVYFGLPELADHYRDPNYWPALFQDMHGGHEIHEAWGVMSATWFGGQTIAGDAIHHRRAHT